jgi:hypothetical protein
VQHGLIAGLRRWAGAAAGLLGAAALVAIIDPARRGAKADPLESSAASESCKLHDASFWNQ